MSLNQLIEDLKGGEMIEDGSGAARGFDDLRDMSHSLKAGSRHIWVALERISKAVDQHVSDDNFDKYAAGRISDAAKQARSAKSMIKRTVNTISVVASYMQRMKGRNKK